MAFAGGCRCGAVRYTLAIDAAPPVYCCHCLDCQRWSGSAFSQQAVVRDGAVSAEGPMVEFRLPSRSGGETVQRACATCHTRLWNTNTGRPGLAVVRAGTLDDSQELAPRAHMWVERKQAWVVLPDGVVAWPRSPTVEQFVGVILR